MAGDWIKMRTNLWDDPRVARLCDLTDQSEAAVIGGLYWLWAMADAHTESGILPGLTCKAIDRKTGVPGLGDALCDVGWLADHPEGVRIVGFEEHNGASAKKRGQTAKRVAAFKAGNAEETPISEEGNAASVTKTLPERYLEKRREEKNSSSLRSEEARASRLPIDWTLPDEWRDWAKAERPELDPLKTSEQFRDYWAAKPGKDGRKTDWLATWRNWVRNQRAPMPVKPTLATAPPITTPPKPGIDPALAKLRAEESNLKPPSAEQLAQLRAIRTAVKVAQ